MDREVQPNSAYARSLFRTEEEKGEEKSNYLRVVISLIYIAIGFGARDEILPYSLKVIYLLSFINLSYAVFLFFLLRAGKYKPIIKYISVCLEVILISTAIWLFGTFRTFKTDAFLAYFLSIALASMRLSPSLTLLSGLLSIGSYILITILSIAYNTVEFGTIAESFTTSKVSGTNIAIKIVFLGAVALIMTYVSKIYHDVVGKSVEKELEIERQKKEREYVIKEMHDGLGNILTNITVASQAAGHVFEDDRDRAKSMLDTIGTYSREATDFMRSGLTALDEPDGEIGFIISGIRHRLGVLFEASGLDVNFDVSDEVDKLKAGAHVNLNIIRCIQEAFNNILKHSRAKNVSLKLYRSGNNLMLDIEDDGIGFDLEGQKTHGLGLKNISKRVEELGGSLLIKTTPWVGTRLMLSIPITSPPSP